MSDSYRVVRLLRNRLYPTYQLFAQMSSKKTSPQDGLRLAALITMHWLRQRLGDAAPAEWSELPDVSDWREADDTQFPSLHINQGYVVDIVSLPEQGMWTMQITEPDLGSDPGNPEQKRPPVPGRVIETNVGFRIVGPTLECGFKTVISDPEGVAQSAEVYRLAVIRQLILHPDFGLRQLTPLVHEAARIVNTEQVKKLVSVWHDAENQLPCVVFSQPIEKDTEQPKSHDAAPAYGVSGASALSELMNIKPAVTLKVPVPSNKAVPIVVLIEAKKPNKKPVISASRLPTSVRRVLEPPYDVTRFAKYAVAFCRTYVLEDSAFRHFCQLSGLNGEPGDIFVLEPESFGGSRRILTLKPSRTRQVETLERLETEMHDYPRGKDVTFGHIEFLSTAREMLLQNTDEALRRSEELGGEWSQKVALLQVEWKSALAEKDKEYAALSEQLSRQREYQARIEREKDALREQHAQELDKLREAIAGEQEENAFLRRKLRQPDRHEGIAAWVEEYFGERLILHPKAVSLLSDKPAKTVDVGLICDALDFLATDYWECRYQIIREDEMLLSCSKKYGRPFEVAPVGERTIQFARDEYTIPYYRDAQGKLQDSELDCHLKVGNDSENLLRIYFLHDDKNRKIVVGSLPRHLTTATIQ